MKHFRPCQYRTNSDNVDDNTITFSLSTEVILYKQLHILLGVSESTYFGIHLQLLLVWIPHENFEKYSWMI